MDYEIQLYDKFRVVKYYNSYIGLINVVAVNQEFSHLTKKEFANKYPDDLLKMKIKVFELMFDKELSTEMTCVARDVVVNDYPWYYTNKSISESLKKNL